MVGPIRTHQGPATAPVKQPPRPPNAWILYRSWAFKNIDKNELSRIAQADVSKRISAQWKNEPDEVRQYWDRMAEIAKAEHMLKYPDYRFQPRKKEDKEREKAEAKKRREEERQAKRTRGRTSDTRASTIPPVPPVLPFPYSPYYDPHVRYGPAGPSPPLSCASSPRDASPYGDTQSPQAELLDSVFPPSPPSQDANTTGLNATLPSTVLSLPQTENTQTPLPSQSIYPSQMLLSQCTQPQSQPSEYQNHPFEPQAIIDSWSNLLDQSQTFPQSSNVNSEPTDPVSLDFPQGIIQQWTTFDFNDFNCVNNDIFQANLLTTNGRSVYKLDSIEPSALEVVPSETIEVSLGSLTPEDINGLFDYTNFDFRAMLPQAIEGSEADLSTCPTDFIDSFFNLDSPLFNDAAFAAETPASLGTESCSITAASGPYIPPTGAANSSLRRVAASWKPTVAFD